MILMNDFKAEPPALREAMAAAASRVFASGWYILGQELKTFEQTWAQACGTAHCVGVGNGLDAIELALRALEIGPGDEVVTTPMTAVATVLAIVRAGARPVLGDIDPSTALLSPDSARRCIGPRTRAVLLVHLYGQVRDMDTWTALAAETGVQLIEDCAQAHLARWGGTVAGGFGVAGAYSFYPTKNLGAIGDGGALVCSDKSLADRVARLRNYGQSERYVHPELGMNSRLDELQAALLTVRLAWLEDFTARRRLVARRYDAGIRHPRVRLLAPAQEDSAHVHHLYALLADDRAALQQHLAARGVQTLIHYPVPMHHQLPFADLRRDPQGLQNTESHAAHCLSIPCHPQLDDEAISHVVDTINAWR